MKTTTTDAEFKKFFADMEWTANLLMKTQNKSRKLFHFDQLDKDTGKLMSNLGAVDVAKEMEKSVIQPGFEQQHVLPSYHTSARKLKAEKKVMCYVLILSSQNIFCLSFSLFLMLKDAASSCVLYYFM